MSEEESQVNSDNYITNQLLLKYDEKFNEKYNQILNLNSSIMNKEELILKINDEILYKNNTITLLKYTIYLIIVLVILYVIKKMGRITNNIFMWSIILSIIIYFIAVYYSIYSTFNVVNTEKSIKSLNIDMKNYVNTLVSKATDYQCPTQCSKVTPPNPNLVQTYDSATLIVDPQTNVWKYGDIPSGGYSPNVTPQQIYSSPQNIPNYNSELNSPKPSFGTTYPRSTYYECKWLGGNSSGMPNTEQTYSTIPCNYRQNYEEVGRYICSEDPNVSGDISTCEKISF
jgi:hypothetical protein